MAELSMFRGDYKQFDIRIEDAGGPRDLSGDELWFTVKRAIADADPGLFQKTKSGGGIAVVGPGLARVTIVPADTTALLATERFLYDVQLRATAGQPRTVDSGGLTVFADVTRSS
jgi:hypothetical protein